MTEKKVLLGHPSNCSSLGNVLNVLVWSQVAVTTFWVLLARRQGLPHAQSLPENPPETPAPPTEVHLRITDACAMPCPSCYAGVSPQGKAVPLMLLQERLKTLAEQGVQRVALGGGEPALHPELAGIVQAARDLGLSLGITTAGMGLNASVLALLKEFAQVNVSLDGLGESYYQSRGYRGDIAALQTLKSLIHEKVRCGINLVLSRSTLQSLENTVETVVALGVREVQLLRYKPAAGADYQQLRLNAEEGRSLWPRIKALIQRFPGVIFRGDCALVPFLSVHPIDQSRLAPFMIRGCHGGDGLQAVDSQGGVHPCSFVQAPLSPAWETGVRAAPCGDCAWQKVCRGGCHAVAQASGDLWAPDPECPRVLAHG